MLNVNDDMDEFIKKAAANYPLKTGIGNWDDVAAALQKDAAPQAGKNNKKLFWLLLLLPLVFGLAVYQYQQSAKPATKVQVSKANTQIIKEKPQEKNIVAGIDTKNSNSTALKSTENHIVILQEQKAENAKLIRRLNKPGYALHENGKNALSNMHQYASKNNKRTDQFFIDKSTDTSTLNPEKNTASGKNNLQGENKINSNKNNIAGYINPIAATQKDTALNSNKKDTSAVKKTKDKKTAPAKQKGFYAGAAIYADASTVKFQSVKHISNAYAVLAGYRFNNTWSAETGLILEAKKYYTTGKYFDKSKAGLSSDYNIHFLNGDCKMFEVPMNVKYDFKSKKKSGFYVLTGLSSYIMKKEKYNYFVTHNSEPAIPGYFKDKDYSSATKNILAIANISGGYQFIYKNNSSLRIEPYLKIPVSGVGIGKLPLMSAGVSAAFTLHLH